MVKRPFEDSGKVPTRCLKGWHKVLQKALSVLNLISVAGGVSPISRIHGFRNQGASMKAVSNGITSSDPLVECVSCSVTFALPVLIPKVEMFPPGNTTMIPLK